MQYPNDLVESVRRTLRSRSTRWLAGEGTWPLALSITGPRAGTLQASTLFDWIEAWRNWKPEGEVLWANRRFPGGGLQRLPDRLVLSDPARVAEIAGLGSTWRRSVSILDRFSSRWPSSGASVLKSIDALLGLEDRDLDRLESLVAWFLANPRSGLFARQLPIRGVDSKWFEGRKELVRRLLAGAGASDSSDFGLRQLPERLHLRILDPALRSRLGGLGDLSLSLDEAAGLDLPFERGLVVENLQTGLALGDYRGTVAILHLGYHVEVLGRLPWLHKLSSCYYWGDIDTHGFAILDRARRHLPSLQSILMDETTLLAHRDLWSFEPNQRAWTELEGLRAVEKELFRKLCENVWAPGVRMEQERLAWSYCEAALGLVLPSFGGPL